MQISHNNVVVQVKFIGDVHEHLQCKPLGHYWLIE